MLEEHVNALNAVKDVLASQWDFNAVINTLVARHVLTNYDEDQIKAANVDQDKVNQFLTIFRKKSDSAFNILVSVLREKNQDHIANLILKDLPVQAAAPKVVRISKPLAEILECQYGLVDELNNRGVLTDRQVSDIRAKKTPFKQNDKLIEFINPLLNDVRKREQILKSLKKTGQSHIAKQIAGNVDLSDPDRPLTEAERYKIKTRHKYFIDNIDLRNTDILRKLRSSNVITDKHMSSIDASNKQKKKKEELLDILKRRSFQQYKEFLRCLRPIRDGVLAYVFETNGELIEMGIPASEDLTNRLVHAYEQHPELAEQIFLKQLLKYDPNLIAKLVSLKTGESVHVYVFCHSLEALHALRKLWDAGQLQSIIKELFNSLLSGTQFTPVLLRYVYLVDYCKCEDYFMKQQGDVSELSAKEIGKWKPLQSVVSNINSLIDTIGTAVVISIYMKADQRISRLKSVLPPKFAEQLMEQNKSIFPQRLYGARVTDTEKLKSTKIDFWLKREHERSWIQAAMDSASTRKTDALSKRLKEALKSEEQLQKTVAEYRMKASSSAVITSGVKQIVKDMESISLPAKQLPSRDWRRSLSIDQTVLLVDEKLKRLYPAEVFTYGKEVRLRLDEKELLMLRQREREGSITLLERDRLLTLQQRQLLREIEALQEQKLTIKHQRDLKEMSMFKRGKEVTLPFDEKELLILRQRERERSITLLERDRYRTATTAELLTLLQKQLQTTEQTDLERQQLEFEYLGHELPR